MKTLIKALAFTAVAAVLLTGCAKPPEAEKAATKASIDNCVKLEAEKYGAQELSGLKSGLASAEAEEKIQNDKFFKNFDKEKEILAKTKADADALASQLPARKEAARQAALAAQTEAQAALDQANALLAQAPKGKGTRADIEAFTADLKAVADDMPNVASMITAEDFLGAKDKATALKDKATTVATQIQSAIDKVKPAKKAKK
jgi:uncharacterized protein (DUF1697 family)